MSEYIFRNLINRLTTMLAQIKKECKPNANTSMLVICRGAASFYEENSTRKECYINHL